jgi:hypothetical protein
MVRAGDRWVPWHLSGGSWNVVESRAHIAANGYGKHVQKALAEVYIGTPGGGLGGGGGGGGGSS